MSRYFGSRMIQKFMLLANLDHWAPFGSDLAAFALRDSPRKGASYSLRAAQVGLRLAQMQQERSGYIISTSIEH